MLLPRGRLGQPDTDLEPEDRVVGLLVAEVLFVHEPSDADLRHMGQLNAELENERFHALARRSRQAPIIKRGSAFPADLEICIELADEHLIRPGRQVVHPARM